MNFNFGIRVSMTFCIFSFLKAFMFSPIYLRLEGDVPPPPTPQNQKIFLSKVRFELAKKRPPKSSKNEMLVFGLHSTSDDQLSDPSGESRSKCKKGLLSHQKK